MSSPTFNTISWNYVPYTGINTLDVLLNQYFWGSYIGNPVHLYYSFPNYQSYWSTAIINYSSSSTDNEPWVNFKPLNNQEKVNVVYALNTWANVANVSFIQAADTSEVVGDLRFAWTSALSSILGSNAAWAYPPGSNPKSGDVWLNNKASVDFTMTPGSFGVMTLIHEIGHALGLDHPFNPASYSTLFNNVYLDSYKYTIMTYSAYTNRPVTYVDFNPTTPMLLDIAAVQYLYGENYSYNSGNTIYSFNQGQHYFQTIWDGGGIDTIVWNATSQNSIIDLRQGYFSQLGNELVYRNYYNSILGYDKDTVAIAYGCVIENATGGDGDDIIIGNDSANILTGGLGDDTITGGAGNDSVIYSGNKSQYTIINNNATWTVRDNTANRDGIDTVSSVEFLKFADQTYSLSTSNITRIGGSGIDTLIGGAGNDILIGLGGADIMDGQEGSDLYAISAANEHTSAEINDTGASGTDEVRFTATTASSLTLYSGDRGIERVVIGTGTAASAVTNGTTALNVNAIEVLNALTISGNAGNNSIDGGQRNDLLVGGAGNDTFNWFASYGSDTMIGGTGADTYVVRSLSDVITENPNEGVDLVWSSVSYNLTTLSNVENLSLFGDSNINGSGNAANNTLTGNTASNILSGLGGTDTLIGGGGNDVINGGTSNDSLRGDWGSDRFVFTTGDSGQTLATLDAIQDFTKGALGTGDIIDFTATLTIGGSSAPATVNAASINISTGIASFARGSGLTLTDALSDITARFNAATNSNGEFAFFKVKKTGNYYVFVSDGNAGITTNDVLIQLVGVTTIGSIDLTDGNLSVLK